MKILTFVVVICFVNVLTQPTRDSKNLGFLENSSSLSIIDISNVLNVYFNEFMTEFNLNINEFQTKIKGIKDININFDEYYRSINNFVGNIDGILEQGKSGFMNSCVKFRVNEGILTAECEKLDGSSSTSSLNIADYLDNIKTENIASSAYEVRNKLSGIENELDSIFNTEALKIKINSIVTRLYNIEVEQKKQQVDKTGQKEEQGVKKKKSN